MTNQEILQKAIEKAVGNGWEDAIAEKLLIENFGMRNLLDRNVYFHLIFSHDFAKAFWGSELIDEINTFTEAWQYHLQQMVLEKEPPKYLTKFL